MSKSIKKIFSSFTSFLTIVWSVGAGTLALPSTASAAVLLTGDLVKASGPAVYYIASDQKRYVFPNEKTYFSWYNDFSTVRTITDAELAAIDIGGNVTIRPGTKLVKITTDPKVYAVTKCGVLHWVESEALASALYGGAWASRVVDVPDGFFVNYSIGSSIPTAVHPDGTLISYTGDASRYLAWGGQKRMFNPDSAFAANMYNALNIINTTISYPNGSDVTGYDPELAQVIAPSCIGAVSTISATLQVSLASDTPAGATVPKNASSVQLAKFNLTAGSSAVTVTGLRFHRVGVGATTDFANVYLYKSDGTRLTTGRTVNSSSNLVEYNSLNLPIGAGETYSVVLVGDFASPASTGGQHSFELMDAASVVITGTGTVSGSFPVRGNVFTVGTTSSARVDVQKGTQPTNPNIGATEAEISNFKLTANTNDVELRRITILQAGSITNSDLTDLKLYQGTTLVATAAALTNDKIVLNFTTPFLLANGTTKVFSLKARIGGRAARTIKTYVEYTTDVYAIDKVYNAGAAICIADTAVGGCTAAGQGSYDGDANGAGDADDNANIITTQGGQLTVAFNGPPAANVAKGTQDVVFYKFSLASPDNQLEIRNVDFTLQGLVVGSGQAGKVKGNAGTEYFRDIKIKNLDTGATVMGPISMPSTCAANATTCAMQLTDSFNMNAGQILNLGFTTDIANTADTGDDVFAGTSTYRIVLGDGTNIFGSSDVRIVNTGEYLATDKIVPNSNITGNGMTIKASNLTVSLASTPSSGTVVKKANMYPSVGFVLTAGAQSSILVTAIKLTGSATTTAAAAGAAFSASLLDDVVTSCALFDGATQVGLAQSPDTTLGTMNLTNMNLNIPAGSSVILTGKCTLDSVVDGTSDLFAIGIAAAADITAQDADANTVTPSLSAGVMGNAATAGQSVIQTVLNSGTLTIQTDNLRQSTILVAGGDVWQNFAQFRATAQFEDIDLERMTVTSTGDAANFTMISIAKDGAVKGQSILPAGVMQNKDVDLTTNKITVPKDGSAIFQVWGKLGNTQSSSSVSGATSGVARSGNTMSLGLASNITTGEWDTNYNDKLNVRAIGSSSGERVYATSTNMTGGVTGNVFVMRKTKPTVTKQSVTNSLATGQTVELYKFQVSADSAGSVALKKFTFNFSKSTGTSSSLSLSSFKLYKGSTQMADADYTIVNQAGDNMKTGTWPVASSTGQIVVQFTGEETISGSGNTYTLKADIGGSLVSGDSVTTQFRRTTDAGVWTGYLTATYGFGYPGAHINTSSSVTSVANADGTFVWSDLSEVPHSSAVDSATNSSRDWTNDLYAETLTDSQTVSKT